MRNKIFQPTILKDVCDEITVGYVGPMSKEYIDDGIPFLRSLNIKAFRLDLSDIKFISKEFHNKISKSSLLEGDVAVVRTGLPGTSTVIPSGFDFLNCSDLVIVRPNRKLVNPYFLSYFFNTVAKKFIGDNVVGAIQQHFNIGSAKEMIINLPDLSYQNKIVKVLNEINQKIELNNKINAELEGMAKLIYEYWFVQFDFPFDFSQGKPADDSSNPKDVKPYKSSGGKMVWNKELKREIPEGWEVKELKDIASITMGQSPPGESYNENSDGTVFYQGCTDFGNRFPTIRKFTTMPTRFANEGDLLLSVRAPVGAINISKEHCCIGRGLAALAAKNGQKTFLFGVMQNLKQIFDRRNVDGTTFGAITKDDLFTIKVLRPEKSILDHFHKLTITSFYKQNKCELENIQLSSLRDWLLPMLMNGQVRVADADVQ